MPDELLQRLRRFHDDYVPGAADQLQDLVRDGQHPTILFIGCSDSHPWPLHWHCTAARDRTIRSPTRVPTGAAALRREVRRRPAQVS